MGFIKLNCPNCGANIELDESREFGFCQYCGTKVIQEKIVVEHRGTVGLDRSAEVNNLLLRADEYFQKQDYKTSLIYYNRVLDIDTNNIAARNRIAEINKIVKTPNFILRRISSKFSDNKKPMTVTIDNKKTVKLNVGDSLSYKLPVGTHRIKVSFLSGKPKFFTVQTNKYPDQSYLILQANLGASVTSIPLTSSKLNSKNVDSKSNKGLGCTLFAIILPIILFTILLAVAIASGSETADSEEKTSSSVVPAYVFSQSDNIINNQILYFK